MLEVTAKFAGREDSEVFTADDGVYRVSERWLWVGKTRINLDRVDWYDVRQVIE